MGRFVGCASARMGVTAVSVLTAKNLSTWDESNVQEKVGHQRRLRQFGKEELVDLSRPQVEVALETVWVRWRVDCFVPLFQLIIVFC